MPVVKGRHGGKIHTEGSDANAYDQFLELPGGSPIMVVTIRVGTERDAEYIDMTPDVAEKVLDDLKIAVPNAKKGASRKVQHEYMTRGDDPTMPGGGPPVYHGPEERYGPGRRVRVHQHFRSKPGGPKRLKYVSVRAHNREV